MVCFGPLSPKYCLVYLACKPSTLLRLLRLLLLSARAHNRLFLLGFWTFAFNSTSACPLKRCCWDATFHKPLRLQFVAKYTCYLYHCRYISPRQKRTKRSERKMHQSFPCFGSHITISFYSPAQSLAKDTEIICMGDHAHA